MTKIWIVCLVALGVIFLMLSETSIIKTFPYFHIETIVAHIGVAFFIAGLVTMALEMPHYKVYVEKALSGIVIKADYLKTLSPAQLLKLRRDCDLVRLDLSKEETESGFPKDEAKTSFYKYVSEDAWTSLITSHYRTNYSHSAVFSNNHCPDGFWMKTFKTKYTFYQGIPSKEKPKQPLRITRKERFDIDSMLLGAQPDYCNSSKNCDLTNEKCCFAGCSTDKCLFISTFKLTIDDVVYSLNLKEKRLFPNKDSNKPIPITITPQLSEGRVTMEFDYEILNKDKAEIEVVESGLIKVDEIYSIKMNIPTRDAVFVFSFPEGITTRAYYFGFKEVNPFDDQDTNNIHARVTSWMFPGDGIAVAWWGQHGHNNGGLVDSTSKSTGVSIPVRRG